MKDWLNQLKANGADLNHPASVQRHAPPDLTQTEVFQRHLGEEMEAAQRAGYAREAREHIDAYFQAQDDFLGKSSVAVNNWNEAVLTGSISDMSTSDKVASAYDLIARMNTSGEYKVCDQRITRETFKALTDHLPTNIRSELQHAYNHPKDLAKLNLDVLMDLKDDANSLDLDKNFKSGHARPVVKGGWLAMTRTHDKGELQEHVSGEQDYSKANVKAWNESGRDLIRNAIMGNERYVAIQGRDCPAFVREIAEGILNKTITLSDSTIEDIDHWAKQHDDTNIFLGGTHLKADGRWNDDKDFGDNIQTPKPSRSSWWGSLKK